MKRQDTEHGYSMFKHYASRAVTLVTYAFLPFSLLYLLAGSQVGLNTFDEALPICGAHTLLRGGLLYRDFWSGYGPGQSYLLAGVFKVFGESVMVARVTMIVLEWLMCGTIYLVARKLVSPSLALLSWFMSVVVCFGYVQGFPPPIPITLASILLSSLCLLNYAASRRSRWLLCAGALAGIATLFRHDFGICGMLAGTAVLALLALKVDNAEAKETLPRRLSALGRMLGYYYLPVMGIVLPVILAVAASVGARYLVDAMVILPLKLFHKYYSLPYPRLPSPTLVFGGKLSPGLYIGEIVTLTPYWLPPLTCGLAAIAICMKRLKRRPWIELLPMVLILLLCGIALNYLRVRPDYAHAIPASFLCCLLLAMVLKEIPRAGTGRIVLGVLAGLVCLCMVFRPISSKVGLIRSMSTDVMTTTDIPRAKGILFLPESMPDEEAVSYIRDHVGPDERIYVGLSRHDAINVNDAMFYFLSEREPATRHVELHRALASQAPCQEEIIRDIQRNHVNYVVIFDLGGDEPNESSRSSGVTILDDFIQANFDPVASFTSHTVWRRKGVSG
jgi:hypothetical protein